MFESSLNALNNWMRAKNFFSICELYLITRLWADFLYDLISNVVKAFGNVLPEGG